LHDLTKTLTTHEHYTLLELDVAWRPNGERPWRRGDRGKS
jgi:hypothetical protein